MVNQRGYLLLFREIIMIMIIMTMVMMMMIIITIIIIATTYIALKQCPEMC